MRGRSQLSTAGYVAGSITSRIDGEVKRMGLDEKAKKAIDILHSPDYFTRCSEKEKSDGI